MRVKILKLLILILLVLFASCKKKSKENFDLAEKYYRSGKVVEAILTYNKVLTGGDDFLRREALFKIALLHKVNLKNIKKAIKIFESYLRKYPKGERADEILLLLGNIYYKNFQAYNNAIVEYQKLIDNYSNSKFKPQAIFNMGKNYFMLNNFNQAIIEYKKLLKDFPNSELKARTLLEIAACYNLSGKQEKSISLYRDLINKYTDKPSIVIMAKFYLASIYEETEELTKALKLYKTIQYTYPNPAIIKLKIDRINYRRSIQGRD